MKKLQFSTTELMRKAMDEPFYFDEMIDISDLADSESNDIKRIADVHVTGFAFVEKNEYIFSFSMTGNMILPCARTLVDVPYTFDISADEVFTEAYQLDDAEDEVHQVSGEMLDLTPFIKEHIILQMPYRVFSDEAGLQEGEGWVLHDEESFEREQSEKIDPRLAKLQQLIDTEKED